MLTVKISPNDKGNPPGKLADAELHFTAVDIVCPACEGTKEIAITLAGGDNRLDDCPTCKGTGVISNPLAGLKLIGFAIWERRGGSGRNVTFPARQYSINAERRSFALLRPIVDVDAQTRVRELILDAYAEYEHIAQAEPIGAPTPFARDLADSIHASTLFAK